MQPGDLLLCRSTGFVGGLIRLGENVRYHGWRKAIKIALGRLQQPASDPCWGNHIAVFVGDDRIIEALGNGLNIAPLSKYPASSFRVLPLASVKSDVTEFDRHDLAAFAYAQLARHDSYGWLSIASIVVQLLTPAKLDLSWDGAVICSAFGAQCWEHAGVILNTRSSLTAMPADLGAMVGQAPKLAAAA